MVTEFNCFFFGACNVNWIPLRCIKMPTFKCEHINSMINCLAVVGSYRGVKAHSFFKLVKAPNANELAFQIVVSNVAF